MASADPSARSSIPWRSQNHSSPLFSIGALFALFPTTSPARSPPETPLSCRADKDAATAAAPRQYSRQPPHWSCPTSPARAETTPLHSPTSHPQRPRSAAPASPTHYPTVPNPPPPDRAASPPHPA